MPNILQLMVRRGSHATAHYSMEYWHDIHGLDVLRWGENGQSDPKELHHHENPTAGLNLKHTKHEWDKSSHTMRYIGIRSAQSVKICVKGYIFVVMRKGHKHYYTWILFYCRRDTWYCTILFDTSYYFSSRCDSLTIPHAALRFGKIVCPMVNRVALPAAQRKTLRRP